MNSFHSLLSFPLGNLILLQYIPHVNTFWKLFSLLLLD
nr:MAG TPA: hypothetical protein [Caudoviricetes sp.]